MRANCSKDSQSRNEMRDFILMYQNLLNVLISLVCFTLFSTRLKGKEHD